MPDTTTHSVATSPLITIGEWLNERDELDFDQSEALAANWNAMEADEALHTRYRQLRGAQEIVDIIDNPLRASGSDDLASPIRGIRVMYAELRDALWNSLNFFRLHVQPDKSVSLYFRGPREGVPFHRGMVEFVCEAYLVFDAAVRQSEYAAQAPTLDQRNTDTGLLVLSLWTEELQARANAITGTDPVSAAQRQAYTLAAEGAMIYGLDGRTDPALDVVSTLGLRLDTYCRWLDSFGLRVMADLCLPD